jgi:hypothetical protein
MVATKPHGTSVERFQSMSDGRVTVVGMWAWAALTAAVCVGLIVLVTGSPWWLVLAPVLVALFYWEIRDIRGLVDVDGGGVLGEYVAGRQGDPGFRGMPALLRGGPC